MIAFQNEREFPLTTYDLTLTTHSIPFMTSDSSFLSRCLQLASLGAGRVSPNPMVGAVLVFNDKVIGEGYHEHYGQAHAEVNCISSVKKEDKQFIKDSVLYVSLEPCCHYGKTPPCTDLILEHQIKKVVVGCKDISSKVNGEGIRKLREQGVEVIEHILEKEAIELNKRFFTFHQKQRPYIILKWAQSIEGFIGSEHKRIKLSNTSTDHLVHQWRAEEDAIWVGYQTARTDNPQLNVRLVKGKNPIRVVYDRDLSLNNQLHLFDQTQPAFIFNTVVSRQENNLEWIKIADENYLHQMLNELYQRQILSVLIEGGSKLIQQCMAANLWDEIRCIQTNTSLNQGIKAPVVSHLQPLSKTEVLDDQILIYRNH